MTDTLGNSKASFYAQRRRSAKVAVAAPEGTYRGENRRCVTRRQVIDRRESVRFELNNEDRRANHGRRVDDRMGHVW